MLNFDLGLALRKYIDVVEPHPPNCNRTCRFLPRAALAIESFIEDRSQSRRRALGSLQTARWIIAANRFRLGFHCWQPDEMLTHKKGDWEAVAKGGGAVKCEERSAGFQSA